MSGCGSWTPSRLTSYKEILQGRQVLPTLSRAALGQGSEGLPGAPRDRTQAPKPQEATAAEWREEHGKSKLKLHRWVAEVVSSLPVTACQSRLNGTGDTTDVPTESEGNDLPVSFSTRIFRLLSSNAKRKGLNLPNMRARPLASQSLAEGHRASAELSWALRMCHCSLFPREPSTLCSLHPK